MVVVAFRDDLVLGGRLLRMHAVEIGHKLLNMAQFIVEVLEIFLGILVLLVVFAFPVFRHNLVCDSLKFTPKKSRSER